MFRLVFDVLQRLQVNQDFPNNLKVHEGVWFLYKFGVRFKATANEGEVKTKPLN